MVQNSEPLSNLDVKHEVDAVYDNATNDEAIDTSFQPGVQKAEAITIAWSFKGLVIAYVVIWLVYFVQGIVSGVIGGVTNLCIAKILDIFGRPHEFLLCVVFGTIGLVMAASCNGVEAYAASQLLYTVGVNGLGYCLSVFIADTSSLRHRGLMQALFNSLYLITSFLNGSGWRWAFGMESILLPATQSGRTPWESAVHYLHEFDVVGLLLISTSFASFLLPFNLYTMEAKVLGTCIAGFTLFLSVTCWNAYFSSFLQVANDLSVAQATYIVQSSTVIQVVANVVAGATILYTGRYKPISVFFALPLIVLGTGLLIQFRQPDRNAGYIIMCNIFINFGFGILMLTVEIDILAAAAAQQYSAISIALLNLFCYIGNAVGYTISSAIWQGTFPGKLALHLPPESQGNLTTIYSTIEEQLSYAWGSPTRLAIQHAYGDTWRYLLIAGVATWSLELVAMLVWKNMNVKGVRQNKGCVV
ncbi:major facilitator superfamily domain-containing protein [Rhexocercosporidium sp. MPI-PUGE-AT-0058]|nr:major facilitator superfamily domain-containing protein [Rhexocercosporidium sp. MPI-PUGE-AT-0058]